MTQRRTERTEPAPQGFGAVCPGRLSRRPGRQLPANKARLRGLRAEPRLPAAGGPYLAGEVPQVSHACAILGAARAALLGRRSAAGDNTAAVHGPVSPARPRHPRSAPPVPPRPPPTALVPPAERSAAPCRDPARGAAARPGTPSSAAAPGATTRRRVETGGEAAPRRLLGAVVPAPPRAARVPPVRTACPGEPRAGRAKRLRGSGGADYGSRGTARCRLCAAVLGLRRQGAALNALCWFHLRRALVKCLQKRPCPANRRLWERSGLASGFVEQARFVLCRCHQVATTDCSPVPLERHAALLGSVVLGEEQLGPKRSSGFGTPTG